VGVFRFDDFELDLSAYELRRGEQVLSLQPKIFDVLCLLVEHRDRVVTKTELLDTLWPGEYVTDTVVSWSVSHVRRVLGQKPGDKLPIETIHGRGYRFRADVSVADTSNRPQAAVATAPVSDRALIGRERVMESLSTRMHEAGAGRGSLTLLTGEAGIGKTRCAEQLLLQASKLGMQTLNGRCPQEPGTPPLWPIASALRRAQQDGTDLLARARAFFETLETTTENDDEGGAGPAGFRAIEQAARLLREVAASRPTLLMLDDLHWADVSTLRLLTFLAPELRAMHLYVLATVREGAETQGGAIEQVRRQLLRHAQTVPLGPFGRNDVAKLVETASGRRPNADLAEAIRRASGGVPLFVQEVVRTLELEHGANQFDALPPGAVRVPDLARDLLRERVRRLPVQTVEVLSHAAVLGEHFDLGLLAALMALEPDVLLEQLEPATLDGQLEGEGPHTYRFAHSTFQSVLYDDLSPRQRVAIHRKAALLLGARVDGTRRGGEIARHYYLSLPAGEHSEVMRKARAAGEDANRLFAFEDAALYFGWAVEAHGFAGEPDPRVHTELLLSLAKAQRSAGRTTDADRNAAQAIHLGRQHGLHDLVVRATGLRRPTVGMGSVPDTLSRAALEALLQQTSENDTIRVSALAQLAFLPPYEADLSRSRTLSARAVELAERHGDPDLLLEALRARLFSLSDPAGVESLLDVAERMLSISGAKTAGWYVGEARTAQYNAYLMCGRIDEAGALLDRMSAAVKGPHFGEATFYCARLQAQRLFQNGRFAEADQRWKEAFEQAARAGVSYAEPFYRAHQFNAKHMRDGAKAVVESARAVLSVRGVVLPPGVRANLCHVAAEAGDLELATAQLQQFGDAAELPRSIGYLHTVANIAAVAAVLVDLPRCEQLRDILTPHADLNTPDVMGAYLGSVSHFLGLLHAALDDHKAAAHFYARAHERNLAMGYRVGVVRTGLAHAALELQAGRRPSARKRLEAARAEARELGMDWAVAKADEALGS
jgi:DNA-binding winged helix-turn-helix (wHTH) protein/tetratricopeptide (TPR) repeat protein